MGILPIVILGLLVALSFGALALISTHVAGLIFIASGLLLGVACFVRDTPGIVWLGEFLTWRGGILECSIVVAVLYPCLVSVERLKRFSRKKDDNELQHPRIFHFLTQPVLEVIIGAWLLPLAVAAALMKTGFTAESLLPQRYAQLLLPPLFLGGFLFWGTIGVFSLLAKRYSHGFFQFLAMACMLVSVNYLGLTATIVSSIIAYGLTYSVTKRAFNWATR